MLGVAHPDANIIFGTVVDESMGDTVGVTVVAAGLIVGTALYDHNRYWKRHSECLW